MKSTKNIQNLVFLIAFFLIISYSAGSLLNFIDNPGLDAFFFFIGIGLILLSIYFFLKSKKPKP
jgi:uncharacterized membrane protein YfcA